MKITKKQLRKLIREQLDDSISVTMPSDNPWIRGKTVQVPRAEAERIAQIAADMGESLRNRQFKNAYNYNTPIMTAINPHLPDDKNEKIAMLRAVKKVLSQRLTRSMRNDWHNGDYAAERVISTLSAYATPGFMAARHNADIYGS